MTMTFAAPDWLLGNGSLANTPALSPPPGVTPNLIDAEAPMRGAFVAVTVLSCSLMTIFVGIRIYTKIAVMKEFLIEDYSLVVAWFGSLVWFGLNFASPANGRHLWDVSLAQELVYAQLINVILIIFAPISFFAKYSVLMQLRRIFTKTRNVIYWLIQISIWLNAVLYLVFMFLGIFQCIPRSKLGNPRVEGKCISLSALLVAPTVLIVLSDLWMLLLPVIIVWKLQLALQRKYAIAAGFLVGLVSVVSAVLQLYYTWTLDMSDDVTYISYKIALWAGVQLASLVIAAAVPAVPRLWLHLRHIDIEESEPSTFGKMPPRQRRAAGAGGNNNDRSQYDALKDVESSTMASRSTTTTYNNNTNNALRAESPFQIHTVTEVQVQSVRMQSIRKQNRSRRYE